MERTADEKGYAMMLKQRRMTCIIICATLLLYLFYAGMHKDNTRLAILGFHHIAPDHEAETHFKGNMWVTKLSTFEEEMKYLYDHGYQSLTLDEVYAWKKEGKKIPEKSVVLTFDDGFLSTIHYAEPILKRYGFHGTVFAIASDIKEHGPYDHTKRQHASLADIKASSLDFYSHTYDLHHKDKGFAIDQKSEKELIKDITQSNALVDGTYLAYPYGHSNPLAKKVLKKNGVKLAFGFNENRKAVISDDDYALPRFCVNRYTKLDVFAAMLEE